MKLRKNNVKREHSTIKGIIPLLEELTNLPYVRAIIPGRIKPIVGNYPVPTIQYKTPTASGIKCIAKSQRSVQEIFIITDTPDVVVQYIKKFAH